MRGAAVEFAVFDAGLACCAIETSGAFAGRPDLFEPAEESLPVGSQLLVVSGTVTDALRPSLLGLIDQLGPTTKIISFGSCANTGGPYWDSYSVTKGVDQVVPVERYVVGCAPTPDALVAAVLELAGS